MVVGALAPVGQAQAFSGFCNMTNQSATPVNVAQIAFVTVTITATPVNGAPGRILTASASIRRRE